MPMAWPPDLKRDSSAQEVEANQVQVLRKPGA
jgi:hypothetical protein